MTDRPCRKNDSDWPFPCNCDDCSRAAAANWNGLMDQVYAGETTLAGANARAGLDDPDLRKERDERPQQA